nr:endoplasmic reticulum oxidoreductin-1-like [Tanacetum cinerariifolium]
SSGESCQEKKVLYKLISGLHASISVHIASDYLLDESTNQKLRRGGSSWSRNMPKRVEFKR